MGRSLARWISDWQTVRGLATPEHIDQLLTGLPVYLGYITSAYKVTNGRVASRPHEYWEAKIAPRVRSRIVEDLKKVDDSLVPHGGNKIAAIKNFHSLAPQAQEIGVAIGKLKGHVNPGYNAQVQEAASEFLAFTHEMCKRMKIKLPKLTK